MPSWRRHIRFRQPSHHDGAAAHALVASCPPLDLNSPYAYFLLCSHFAATTALAELDEVPVGFLGGYRLPQAPDTLFVWQVAVLPGLRGQRVAEGMLRAVLARPANRGIRRVDATVTPSNLPSRRFFAGLARHWNAPLVEQPFLAATDFGTVAHEDEILVRIGPVADFSASLRATL